MGDKSAETTSYQGIYHKQKAFGRQLPKVTGARPGLAPFLNCQNGDKGVK